MTHSLVFATIALLLSAQSPTPATKQPFTVVESNIREMQTAMQQGRITSREIVLQYLTRIATYEDKLNAVIAVNPHALEEAEARDRERTAGKIRGPLHGIPIALKDNIHTTELANWVATGMPANYNGLAGHGFNPYDPRRDPREATFDGRPALFTSGSSSGVGTAANFWAANVGTETSGSILSPSNQNMLVGIKPTLGRVSRYGVIPITADQDTPGPMTKTVSDAAIMLGVLEGA